MGMGKRFADASMVARFSSLENKLSGTLKPVAARKEFVHGLGQRIQARPRSTCVNNVANWPILALLVAGLVSLAVFLAMVARALLDMAGKNASPRDHLVRLAEYCINIWTQIAVYPMVFI
jgi:hypothetical protein